jgi:hypothetical protein
MSLKTYWRQVTRSARLGELPRPEDMRADITIKLTCCNCRNDMLMMVKHNPTVTWVNNVFCVPCNGISPMTWVRVTR